MSAAEVALRVGCDVTYVYRLRGLDPVEWRPESGPGTRPRYYWWADEVEAFALAREALNLEYADVTARLRRVRGRRV